MAMDNATADYIGKAAYRQFVALLSTGIAFGIYLAVVFAAIQNLQRRRKDSKPARILLGTICALAVATTAYTILRCAEAFCLFSFIHHPAEDPTRTPLTSRLARGSRIVTKLDIAHTVFRNLILFASDCIVVWRAWAFWRQSVPVKLILGSLSVVSAGCFAADIIVTGIVFNGHMDRGDQIEYALRAGASFVSLGVNFIATLFIGLKTWRADVFRSRNNETGSVRSFKLQQTVSTLIEFGIALCIVQAIHGTLALLYQKSAMSPPNISTGAMTYSALVDVLVIAVALQAPLTVLVIAGDRSSLNPAYRVTSLGVTPPGSRTAGGSTTFGASTARLPFHSHDEGQDSSWMTSGKTAGPPFDHSVTAVHVTQTSFQDKSF